MTHAATGARCKGSEASASPEPCGEQSMRFIGVAALLAMLAGCAVVKVPVPVGGSRADGNIVMGYTYGLFEKPQVDGQRTVQEAANRCAAWGYTGAQAFGTYSNNCIAWDGQGACWQWRVTIPYQCTGGGLR